MLNAIYEIYSNMKLIVKNGYPHCLYKSILSVRL